ncbi:hypothetical protein [Micromonospora arida]|uniref:hypothetical protein n=1 Tax=Micromonospora arida TaxID=2203715 RepID=UPI003F4CFC82
MGATPPPTPSAQTLEHGERVDPGGVEDEAQPVQVPLAGARLRGVGAEGHPQLGVTILVGRAEVDDLVAHDELHRGQSGVLHVIGEREGGVQAVQHDLVGEQADARLEVGQYGRAVECYERTLELTRDLGDRWGEADTLSRLGDTRHALGDPTSGRADWQRALDIFTALDHADAAAVRAKLQLP